MTSPVAVIQDPASLAGSINSVDQGESRIYRYPPLKEPNSIRILCLDPRQGDDDDDDDELKGTLQIGSLDDPTLTFEAISYVWGPAEFPHTIVIDGGILRITESLYLALRTLRNTDTVRKLWVDAVCIDQASLTERNHQVTLMRRIYSQCVRCLAYLGPEADGSGNVPAFIDSIWDWVHSDAWSKAPTWKKGPIFSAIPPAGLPSHTDSGWQDLIHFFIRPWFRRLWIIQEAVLPEEVVLYCGDWAMPANDLYVFRLLLAVYKFGSLFDQDMDESLNNDFMKTWENLQSYVHFRICKKKPCGIPAEQMQKNQIPEFLRLRRLLSSSTFCEVTDPRDRFYALLGLADDVGDSIIPDYSKTFDQVVQDFVGFFISKGQGADLLRGVSAEPSRLTLPRTHPSWMWKWEYSSADMHSGNVSSAVLRVRDHGKDGSRFSKAVSQLSNSKILVRGFLVDRISRRTTRSNDLSTEFFNEALSMARDSDKVSPLELVEEKYYRTLVSDCTHDTEVYPTPPEFLAQCKKRIKFGDEPWSVYDEEYRIMPDIVEQNAFAELALRHTTNAAFGVTGSGRFGMFPDCSVVGDYIFMIDGGVRTYLVRHHPEDDVHSWLGQVFVYDLDDQIDLVQASDPAELTVI